ncbi:MAG: nitrate/nitrite transporter NrtS [Mycobacterium sp.]|nr:nitrate/nitrite transporter NrtS [Mycobacterium sp.]
MADNRSKAVSWNRPAEGLGLFLRGRTLRTAVPTALVVGTVLSAVNQGGPLIGGHQSAQTWISIVVNYLVPLVVSSIGYLAACRRDPSRTGIG